MSDGAATGLAVTHDWVLRGRLRLEQPARGARITSDPLLLAHFVAAGRPAARRVLDLGTGTGVIALVLAEAWPRAELAGVELEPALAELARRNAVASAHAGRVTIVEGDLRARGRALALPQLAYDVIVANPPYTEAGRGIAPAPGARRTARLESQVTLAEVVAAAASRLAPKGRFAVILPPGRTPELFAAFAARKLTPRRLRGVHSQPDEVARRVLVEATREGVGDFAVLPPLVVHGADRRSPTPEANAILEGDWLAPATAG